MTPIPHTLKWDTGWGLVPLRRKSNGDIGREVKASGYSKMCFTFAPLMEAHLSGCNEGVSPPVVDDGITLRSYLG